jgi:hypothetical protein
MALTGVEPGALVFEVTGSVVVENSMSPPVGLDDFRDRVFVPLALRQPCASVGVGATVQGIEGAREDSQA